MPCKTFSNIAWIVLYLISAVGFPLKSFFYLKVWGFFSSFAQVHFKVSPNQSSGSFFQATAFFFLPLVSLCTPVSYNDMFPQGKLHSKSFTDFSSFFLQFSLNKSFLLHISQQGLLLVKDSKLKFPSRQMRLFKGDTFTLQKSQLFLLYF